MRVHAVMQPRLLLLALAAAALLLPFTASALTFRQRFEQRFLSPSQVADSSPSDDADERVAEPSAAAQSPSEEPLQTAWREPEFIAAEEETAAVPSDAVLGELLEAAVSRRQQAREQEPATTDS